MAPSSNGLGQRPFKPLIAGSNPRGVIGEGIMPDDNMPCGRCAHPFSTHVGYLAKAPCSKCRCSSYKPLLLFKEKMTQLDNSRRMEISTIMSCSGDEQENKDGKICPFSDDIQVVDSSKFEFPLT